MLGVPWLVGCGIAGRLTARTVLVLVGAVALFLAWDRLQGWCRPRQAGEERRIAAADILVIVVGLGALAAALGGLPWPMLAAFIAAEVLLVLIGVLLVRARRDHLLGGQVLAAWSLPLTAPAAYLASGGTSGPRAAALWLVDVAFFLWAVFYVRLKIAARARRSPFGGVAARFGFAAPTLAAAAALAALALFALRLGGFSSAGLAAFAPAGVQSIAGTLHLHHPAPLKRVGLLMLAHALAFAVLLVLFV